MDENTEYDATDKLKFGKFTNGGGGELVNKVSSYRYSRYFHVTLIMQYIETKIIKKICLQVATLDGAIIFDSMRMILTIFSCFKINEKC